MAKKTKSIEWKSKKEMIIWHIVNSISAGLFVILGAIADGAISRPELITSLGAAGIVALTKFREFWDTTKKARPTPGLFHFIH